MLVFVLWNSRHGKWRVWCGEKIIPINYWSTNWDPLRTHVQICFGDINSRGVCAVMLRENCRRGDSWIILAKAPNTMCLHNLTIFLLFAIRAPPSCSYMAVHTCPNFINQRLVPPNSALTEALHFSPSFFSFLPLSLLAFPWLSLCSFSLKCTKRGCEIFIIPRSPCNQKLHARSSPVHSHDPSKSIRLLSCDTRDASRATARCAAMMIAPDTSPKFFH